MACPQHCPARTGRVAEKSGESTMLCNDLPEHVVAEVERLGRLSPAALQSAVTGLLSNVGSVICINELQLLPADRPRLLWFFVARSLL